MKKRWRSAAAGAGVLGLGAVMLLTGGPGREDARGAAPRHVGEVRAERSSKSARGQDGNGPAARQVDEMAQREGRRWVVAAADPEVMEDLLVQHGSLPARVAQEDVQGTGPDGLAADAVAAGESSGGAGTIADFATQVRAHREGRREFMRDRQAELASHQPGCKCAHHGGE